MVYKQRFFVVGRRKIKNAGEGTCITFRMGRCHRPLQIFSTPILGNWLILLHNLLWLLYYHLLQLCVPFFCQFEKFLCHTNETLLYQKANSSFILAGTPEPFISPKIFIIQAAPTLISVLPIGKLHTALIMFSN